MNIEHVALYVNKLEVEKNFFAHYFGAQSSEKYTNFRNDFSSYFLAFDNGAQLEIMHRISMIDPKKDKYRSGYHHIAINVGSKEDVDNITSDMVARFFFVITNARKTGDGFYARRNFGYPIAIEIETLANKTSRDFFD